MGVYLHDELVHNLETPREVVPVLIQILKIQSVLDVGCGIGTWLRVFQDEGVHDVLGLDGDHVDRSLLRISEKYFQTYDLSKRWTLSRKFDLVMSLEVAEHLPPEASDLFVECLVAHGDTILFSAAIPGQGGQNHLNEQWPAYWQGKFAKHGFYFHDTIRPLFWNNSRVQWWYRQNIFLVTRQPNDKPVLDLVHPELFSSCVGTLQHTLEGELGVEQAVRILKKAFGKSLRRKLGRK